MVENRRRQHCA